MANREKILFKARLAKQAGRFDEMVSEIKKVALLGVELTKDERILLCLAYRTAVKARKTAYRNISAMEQQAIRDGDHHRQEMACSYRIHVENEIKMICHDIIHILENRLIPISSSGESKTIYFKMAGDFYRYLAEIETDEMERNQISEICLLTYIAAYNIARSELPTVHIVRIALALNLSIFYYEIMNLVEEACRVSKLAFDEAVTEIGTLQDEEYRQVLHVMKMLFMHLRTWTNNLSDVAEKEPVHQLEDQGDS